MSDSISIFHQKDIYIVVQPVMIKCQGSRIQQQNMNGDIHFCSARCSVHLVQSFSTTWENPIITGRIQIRVLTNCQAISTEIGTDSLKI